MSAMFLPAASFRFRWGRKDNAENSHRRMTSVWETKGFLPWSKPRRFSNMEVPPRDMATNVQEESLKAKVARGEAIMHEHSTPVEQFLENLEDRESAVCIKFTAARLRLKGLSTVRQMLLAEKATISQIFRDRLTNPLAARAEKMAMEA